jgi:hypothetical protein
MNDKTDAGDDLRQAIEHSAAVNYFAAPLIGGREKSGASRPVLAGRQTRRVVGRWSRRSRPTSSRGAGARRQGLPRLERDAGRRAPRRWSRRRPDGGEPRCR